MNKKRMGIASLVVSASLFVGVAVNEGYKDPAYVPIKGDVPTIGFGETKNVHMGDKTTVIRSLIDLQNDLNHRKEQLATCVFVPLSQNELDAYMDLAYNIGTKAFCGSTVVKLLNEYEYKAACYHILDWDVFHGKHLESLHVRREKEFEQCMVDQ
ncbi:MAG: glycoside hydrolase family protein [Bradyrhizobium sp.]|nr:glycoside hydrolase family protein [Bradyrhizobium sp.]